VLDANAHAFVTSFMADVASVAGYGADRIWTIARIKEFLLEALARGDAGDRSWAKLYRSVADLLQNAADPPHDPGAVASLRSFLRENDDLGHA